MESFIVRVWVPADGEGGEGGTLRGQLVRLSTGGTQTFREEQELLALIRTGLDGGVRLPEGVADRDGSPADGKELASIEDGGAAGD